MEKQISQRIYPRILAVRAIERIPPEILGEIFHFLCPGSVSIPSVNFNTLWSASQTCSRWRGVALGVHHLWNNLSITFYGEHRSDRRMVYFAKQCLLRSENAHLFLNISENAPYALSGISFLIPHSSRIRHLSINARNKLSFMAFPSLKSLYMKTLPYNYTLMEKTPALEELRIDDELPLTVLEWISNGKIWSSLRLIECNVSARLLDRFLDMIESRARREDFGLVRITEGVLRCQQYKAAEEQWERVHVLQNQGIRIDLNEIL